MNSSRREPKGSWASRYWASSLEYILVFGGLILCAGSQQCIAHCRKDICPSVDMRRQIDQWRHAEASY